MSADSGVPSPPAEGAPSLHIGSGPEAGRAFRSWVSDGCTDAQAESFVRARTATPATSQGIPVRLGVVASRHIQHLIRLARVTLGVDGVQLRLVRAAEAGVEPGSWTVSTAASTLPLVADAPTSLHGTLDAVALEWNQTLMIDDLLASVWRITRPPERTALAFLGQPIDVGKGVRGVVWAWSRSRREWTAEDGRTLARFAAAVTEELAAGAPLENGELALRWRDTVLAALTSRSPLALVAIDHQSDEVLLYSQRFLELFGLERLEPRLATCNVDARELDAACRERMFSLNGEPARPAFPLMGGGNSDELLDLADGRTLRRVAFPVPSADDDTMPPMCEGYAFEDVTGRVRAERAFDDRSRLLQAVLASSPLALVATAVDGTTLMWNHAAERAFGWRAEEVVGSVSPAIPDEERPLHAAERAAALASVPWEGREVELVRRDGTRIHMAAYSSVMPVSDWSTVTPSGAAEAAVLTAYADLTERQELEQRLRDAQKREVVGRLAAGTAHDFNNLLTAIIGYADLTLETLDPRTSAARDVMEIRQTAERATCLTRQLLAFTRRTPTGGGICEPSDIVRSLDSLLRRLAGPEIELDWLLQATGTVSVDPVHLEQIVVNLVVNARDAMPDGGMVVIETDDVVIGEDGRAEGADSPWHAPTGLPAGGYVVVAVRDQGDGISPDVRERIFEPFFTTKSEDRGTGLGLSVTADIVRHAGGAISVETAVARGTSFEIYLPLAPSRRRITPIPVAPKPLAAPARRPGMRVLLVEDDDALRHLLARVLRRAEVTVIEARHGEEALALVRRTMEGRPGAPFDVLVSNVIMPRLGGGRLADALLGMMPALRVVLMSGHPERLAASAYDRPWETLHKPFTPAALLELLDRNVAAVPG